MPEKGKCSLWERRWSQTMPDEAVAAAARKGLVNVDCLPEERREAVKKLV